MGRLIVGKIDEQSERHLFSRSLIQKKTPGEEFERIALSQLSHLYTASYYLSRNEGEAEDLVQETYLRAFRFFDRFEPGTNCRAWLLSILRNVFINRYREKGRQPEMVDREKADQAYDSMLEQAEEAEKDNPENLLFSKLTDLEVEKALKELPEEYRMAIVLVDIEELTYEEAAKVMGCSIGTVRSRVSRGRRVMQVALREYTLKRCLVKE